MEKLLKNGNHNGPFIAVVERLGLGKKDKFSRGIWITKEDIKKMQRTHQCKRRMGTWY